MVDRERIRTAIAVIILVGSLGFLLYNTDTIVNFNNCLPCEKHHTQAEVEREEEAKQEEVPCPPLSSTKCEEAPPCLCPECPKIEEKEPAPCPQPPPPVVVNSPCPVPDPCPGEELADGLESEKYRWKGNSITIGPSPWHEKCFWAQVHFSSEVQFEMCLREYGDIVSDAIKNGGRWGDCDILVAMWGQNPRADAKVRENDPEGIFVDAGANIGSCSLLMAGHGHRTYGFEPLRANLFYMTSAILGNDQLYKDKITLYEMGLGTHSLNVPAYAASGNAGNTQLGSMVKDWDSQTWKEEQAIPVMSLDDVLWPNATLPPPHIKLMKMDVQGYEVKILKGANRLLAAGAIGIVKSELTTMFLSGQGTSAMEMVGIMRDHGYVLTGEHDENFEMDINGPIWDGEVVFRYKGKQ